MRKIKHGDVKMTEEFLDTRYAGKISNRLNQKNEELTGRKFIYQIVNETTTQTANVFNESPHPLCSLQHFFFFN